MAAFVAKTHCPQGHSYDEANTHWRERDGRRWKVCRQCMADKRRQARQRPQGEPDVSEPAVVAVEADVVQPARQHGDAYKLCMACGQNVLRASYREGASECPACEVQGLDAAAGATYRDGAPGEARGAPEGIVGIAVEGSPDAATWLAAVCGQRDVRGLTLDVLAETMRGMQAERAAMIGRVTRYGAVPGALTPEDVPLEVAAQALYLACDPVLQDQLTAAQEVLGLALNQVILGNLAYHQQGLLEQDPRLVPEASYAVQYETGVSGRGRSRGLTSMPGGRLVDAQGQLVKACLCCGREFHPPRDRPNPDFCDDYCGTFVDQLRIWATNTVLNELRYPGQTDTAPLPDPRTFWQVERCQEPYIGHALAFREGRMQQQMELARQQQQKMRGLG